MTVIPPAAAVPGIEMDEVDDAETVVVLFLAPDPEAEAEAAAEDMMVSRREDVRYRCEL